MVDIETLGIMAVRYGDIAMTAAWHGACASFTQTLAPQMALHEATLTFLST